MVCVPLPAVAGLKVPAVTPGPEYVPPEGDPPVSVIAVALSHIALNAASVTVGNGFTVTVTGFEAEQPAALIPVTVYVVVVDGFASTLAPLVVFSPVPGDQE